VHVAISQSSKSGNILDINTFPVGIIRRRRRVASRPPPEPSSIVQIEEENCADRRHLEVMMRRSIYRRDSKDAHPLNPKIASFFTGRQALFKSRFHHIIGTQRPMEVNIVLEGAIEVPIANNVTN
jgi:hypothetical protein